MVVTRFPATELMGTMHERVAVFRNEAGTQEALETVRRLKEEAKTAYIDDRGSIFNQDVLAAIELGYMLDNAECVCVSAIERKESRGAHYRTDFPHPREEGRPQRAARARSGICQRR